MTEKLIYDSARDSQYFPNEFKETDTELGTYMDGFKMTLTTPTISKFEKDTYGKLRAFVDIIDEDKAQLELLNTDLFNHLLQTFPGVKFSLKAPYYSNNIYVKWIPKYKGQENGVAVKVGDQPKEYHNVEKLNEINGQHKGKAAFATVNCRLWTRKVAEEEIVCGFYFTMKEVEY